MTWCHMTRKSTCGDAPSLEDRRQNELSALVRDKVEMERILAIKQNAFDQRHDIPGRVIAGTHDRYLDDLKENKSYGLYLYHHHSRRL